MSNVDEEEQYYVLEIVSDSLRSQSELPEKKREVLATLVDEVKTSLGSRKPEAGSRKRIIKADYITIH